MQSCRTKYIHLRVKNAGMIVYKLYDIIQTSLGSKSGRNLMNYKQDTNAAREALLWLLLLVSEIRKNCRDTPKEPQSPRSWTFQTSQLILLLDCLSLLAFNILLLILLQTEVSWSAMSLSKQADLTGKRNTIRTCTECRVSNVPPLLTDFSTLRIGPPMSCNQNNQAACFTSISEPGFVHVHLHRLMHASESGKSRAPCGVELPGSWSTSWCWKYDRCQTRLEGNPLVKAGFVHLLFLFTRQCLDHRHG